MYSISLRAVSWAVCVSIAKNSTYFVNKSVTTRTYLYLPFDKGNGPNTSAATIWFGLDVYIGLSFSTICFDVVSESVPVVLVDYSLQRFLSTKMSASQSVMTILENKISVGLGYNVLAKNSVVIVHIFSVQVIVNQFQTWPLFVKTLSLCICKFINCRTCFMSVKEFNDPRKIRIRRLSWVNVLWF